MGYQDQIPEHVELPSHYTGWSVTNLVLSILSLVSVFGYLFSVFAIVAAVTALIMSNMTRNNLRERQGQWLNRARIFSKIAKGHNIAATIAIIIAFIIGSIFWITTLAS